MRDLKCLLRSFIRPAIPFQTAKFSNQLTHISYTHVVSENLGNPPRSHVARFFKSPSSQQIACGFYSPKLAGIPTLQAGLH